MADDQSLETEATELLRTLIRNVRREQKAGKPPRAFRELFRLLKSLDAGTATPS